MTTNEQVLQSLITMCRDNEIIPPDLDLNGASELFEYGVIDSMGLTVLAFAIEEDYGVLISTDLLLAELRTPLAIADYIVNNSEKIPTTKQAETQL